MKSVAIVDTLYPEFLKTINSWPVDYAAALNQVLGLSFGTSDFLSRAFIEWGWSAVDIIANAEELSSRWKHDHSGHLNHRGTILEQIEQSDAEVIFAQDLGYFSISELDALRHNHLLVGQCSCAWTDIEKLKRFDLIFTSFPFYVDLFRRLDVKAVYLPLAFDPVVLWRTARTIDVREYACSFIGGFGWQWTNAQALLRHVNESIENVRFYGYGAIPDELRAKYHGEAWGLDMYHVLRRSQIVLNRHGAIAQGYSNNLRLFEATGCGALVLTEESHNLRELFTEDEVVSYSSPADAVDKIRYYIEHPIERMLIASNGQLRTQRDHTYQRRMSVIDLELKAMLGETIDAI